MFDALDGAQLFDANHTISLAMEGREVPRRKPGRPRKPKPTELQVEVLISDDPSKPNEELPSTDDIVDPEQALELMFKEAEEKRLTSGDLSRFRRRRRLPQRYRSNKKNYHLGLNILVLSINLLSLSGFRGKCKGKNSKRF